MTDVLIAPSILAGDFSRIGDEVEAVDRAGADWIHLDIMDGHFVPNISFGPDVVKAIRGRTRKPFDVHLMIAPADPYLTEFARAGADHILVHVEAGPHVHRSLQAIRSLGCKAGVVLNPGTPFEAALPVLDLVEVILVMTVNPGFGGQAFLPSMLPKVAAVRKAADATGRHIHVMVDGGIAHGTAPLAIASGADVLVAGTAVFAAADYGSAIAALRPAGAA